MKSPIKETPEQIVIDKTKVESLSKRFLAAAKAFLQTVFTPAEWDRLGLEKTWRFFLPAIIVLSLWSLQYLAYVLAFVTLMITAVWLIKPFLKSKK